jgi:DNA-binding transcriptional ArsR family regulator
MIAVITGDIINSQSASAASWTLALKAALNNYGKAPKTWEIYRGDSFQLETEPGKALHAALYLKAVIKQFKNLDIRLAIGLGEKEHSAAHITESNGKAFVHSGQCFEELRKKSLGFRSGNEEVDEEINLYFQLAMLTIDRWPTTACKVMQLALENPELTQTELAKKMKKSQSTISESLKRLGYDEMMLLKERFEKLTEKL